MISSSVAPAMLGVLLPVGLGGAILLLLLLWMLRQQRFLHRLSLSLRDMERSNREAQRDLFLILRSSLGFTEFLHASRLDGAGRNESRVDDGTNANGLSLDDVRLLVALSGKIRSDRPSSLAGNLKDLEGFENLEANLRSLRKRGFIFYSYVSDELAILPKGLRYLGRLKA